MSTHARHLTTREGHDDQARLRRCSHRGTGYVGAGGGVAWATIPDSGGVIQGCYNNGGNLKVVSELPCPKGYTSLPWNQQGPKGDPGTDGVSPDRNTTLRDGTTATFDSTGNLSLTTNGTGLFRASGPLNLQGSVINMN
jgi:hypothetical protein